MEAQDFTFWKLSMGPGTSGGEFATRAAVDEWVEKRIALVWGPTGAKGVSRHTQGDLFKGTVKDAAKEGDFFYLCYGNETPSIILIGRFDGPATATTVPGGRPDWIGRNFTLVANAKSAKKYDGINKWWTPVHNSTFVKIPPDELQMFESVILGPYFGISLADLPGR